MTKGDKRDRPLCHVTKGTVPFVTLCHIPFVMKSLRNNILAIDVYSFVAPEFQCLAARAGCKR